MNNPVQVGIKEAEIRSYERKDFTSDQIVRWCPGCGDYSVLAQTQRVMPRICEELQVPKEDVVFVSGIGCSSRFPYYMDTYGFHTIHGRAPTFASGLKLTRPELMVWIVTGDGDGLSIGGNHLVHCLRRNMDVKILLFNNRIYGLTKGQYSPTSELGKQTGSSPFGTTEQPINPLLVALAAEATFVGRAIDTDSENLQSLLLRAAHHKGSAFIEIFQNCNVFNDGAFDNFRERKVRAERTLDLQHNQPLIFGHEKEKCLTMSVDAGKPGLKVANVADVDPSQILIHNESDSNSTLAMLLAKLDLPDFPVPLGVVRAIERPTYGQLLEEQIANAQEKQGVGQLAKLLDSGDTWSVS